MAKKAYLRIETKEEFDDLFNRIYREAREIGFEEGQKYALSIILEPIFDHFSPEMLNEVDRIICRRKEHELHKKMEEKKNGEKIEEIDH